MEDNYTDDLTLWDKLCLTGFALAMLGFGGSIVALGLYKSIWRKK